MDIITRRLRGEFDKQFNNHLRQLINWGFTPRQHIGETYMVSPVANVTPEMLVEIRSWGWTIWKQPWLDKNLKQRLIA